jgi:branched-subunit amino acid ABC-type transport system permease component
VLFAIINGLAVGSAMFLVAAGLTFVFGILRVLNFAHGHFFMIGAYVAFSIVGQNPGTMWAYLGASLAAGLVVGVLGVITDFLVLRRLRDVDHAYMMIGTFAVLMICGGASKLIWGLDSYAISPPTVLGSAIFVGDLFIHTFSMFVIGISILIYILLEIAIHRMWFGKILQALAHDPWMAGMLGINVTVLYTVAVVAAFFLAGLAGGLLLPNQGLSPTLAFSFLLHAFVAVIIGGLGNIRGAFIASMAMGLIESVSLVVLPNAPGLAIYIVMVGFLLWRPQGLFGRKIA